jgi:hypothetical protein
MAYVLELNFYNVKRKEKLTLFRLLATTFSPLVLAFSNFMLALFTI